MLHSLLSLLKRHKPRSIFIFSLFISLLFIPIVLPVFSLNGPEVSIGLNYLDVAYAQVDGVETPNCSSGGWFPSGAELGCYIITHFVHGVWALTQILAALVASFFDYILWYSLQSSTYTDSKFILGGWGILRDLANIIFIVGLVWAAAEFLLNKAEAAQKKVVNIIITALLVNFSLFGVKIVVDAGNILTYAFYNQMEVVSPSSDPANNSPLSPVSALFSPTGGGGSYIDVSVGLVSKMNPQKIILGAKDLLSSNSDAYGLVYWSIFMLMAGINLLLVYVFTSLAISLLTRTITLMISMIVAPLAVATYAIPQLVNQKTFGFTSWMSDVIRASFMAPIVVFFLYLVLLFMDSGSYGAAVGGATAGGQLTLIGTFLGVIIPLAIIGTLLLKSSKIAKDMSGSMGSAISGAIGAAAGVAIGGTIAVASGGTSLAAGAAAKGLQATAGQIGARAVAKGSTSKGAKFLANASFDARNTWAARKSGSLRDMVAGQTDNILKSSTGSSGAMGMNVSNMAGKITRKGNEAGRLEKQANIAGQDLENKKALAADKEEKYEAGLKEKEKEIKESDEKVTEQKTEVKDLQKEIKQYKRELDAAQNEDQKQAAKQKLLSTQMELLDAQDSLKETKAAAAAIKEEIADKAGYSKAEDKDGNMTFSGGRKSEQDEIKKSEAVVKAAQAKAKRIREDTMFAAKKGGVRGKVRRSKVPGIGRRDRTEGGDAVAYGRANFGGTGDGGSTTTTP